MTPMTPSSRVATFGFANGSGSVHMARSFMLDELQTLLTYLPDPGANHSAYRHAIVDDNCLGKRSGKTRLLTIRHLTELYALDPAAPLFHALRYYWSRDPDGQPLLALLCACARDPLLRSTAPLVLAVPHGAPMPRIAMEEFLTKTNPNRFSSATLKSVAQNVLATWTRSGHLSGKVNKIRSQPVATPGAGAYALYLSTLLGARGQLVFDTPYTALLDCSIPQRFDLAARAALRQWLVLKRLGDVVEVNFPALITNLEMGWFHE